MSAERPGVYNLGDLTITTADTQETDWTDNLDGMEAVTLQVRFVYGSGGTTILVYIQTSLDGGTTPIDVACFEFDLTSKVYLLGLSGGDTNEMILEPTDGVLGAGYVVNGVLGNRLRMKVVSTGTYAGSTLLSARAAVR